MIELLSLRKNSRVLEVGTGSGYSTAILASIAKDVVTIDYHERLAKDAKVRLLGMGFNNIRFFSGEVTKNYKDLGDFDAFTYLIQPSLNYYREPFRFRIEYNLIEGEYSGLGFYKDRDNLMFKFDYMI